MLKVLIFNSGENPEMLRIHLIIFKIEFKSKDCSGNGNSHSKYYSREALVLVALKDYHLTFLPGMLKQHSSCFHYLQQLKKTESIAPQSCTATDLRQRSQTATREIPVGYKGGKNINRSSNTLEKAAWRGCGISLCIDVHAWSVQAEQSELLMMLPLLWAVCQT